MVMKRKSKKSVRIIPKMDTLKQINLNAAGIDVGSSELWVCVPEGRAEKAVRVFQTFTRDLHEIAHWLKACGVTTMAMESTDIMNLQLDNVISDITGVTGMRIIRQWVNFHKAHPQPNPHNRRR